MNLISTNFEVELEELEEKVWEVIKKYNCGMPYPSGVPVYLIEVQFIRDDYEDPIGAKSIWIKFSTENFDYAKEILKDNDITDNPRTEILRELKKVLEQFFGVKVFLYEVRVWSVIPLNVC